jgi:cation:H+ antiporter
MYALSILGGIALLIWGADRMVLGASVTARNLGISPMIIGLTVLGFVTSAPEMLVSATAALAGAPNLALGNAIGSNIANIGLVAGAAAIVRPLRTESKTLRRELGAMTIVCIAPIIFFIDAQLGRLDGIFLLLILLAFIYWVIRLGLQTRGHDAIEAQYAAEIPANVTNLAAIGWLFFGLALLLAGANALVWGSENLARAVGISDLLIGITLVAIGTSLPELAVSITAALKGEHGLAIGNIIGSNAFNMLAVVGIAAVIHPAQLDLSILTLHLPVMGGFTVAFFFMSYNDGNTIQISRPKAACLLSGFVAYHGYLVTQIL